jgi:hypothetical protein
MRGLDRDALGKGQREAMALHRPSISDNHGQIVAASHDSGDSDATIDSALEAARPQAMVPGPEVCHAPPGPDRVTSNDLRTSGR